MGGTVSMIKGSSPKEISFGVFAARDFKCQQGEIA